MQVVRAVWCTLQSSNQRAKLINVHNPTHPYSFTLIYSLAYQYACIAEKKKEAKIKISFFQIVTASQHTPLTKLLNSEISFPLPTHTRTHEHPYAYSLTQTLAHSLAFTNKLTCIFSLTLSFASRLTRAAISSCRHPSLPSLLACMAAVMPPYTHTHTQWVGMREGGRQRREKEKRRRRRNKEEISRNRQKKIIIRKNIWIKKINSE